MTSLGSNLIEFVRSATDIRTCGLKRLRLPEMVVTVNTSDLISYAEDFLRHVVSYQKVSERKIVHGETFPYGYWLVKFQECGGLLDTWEYDSQASKFVHGASLTLSYWRDQHSICERLQARFVPPRADKLTIIDKGVMEGLRVQGVRYPSPEHMSGWWITTDDYRGDASTLLREHTYHVTSARPDLAQYLALPYGFRFDLSGEHSEVWFDKRIANEAREG